MSSTVRGRARAELVALQRLFRAELRRRGPPRWTPFDYRMRRLSGVAQRIGDSMLVGASLELQASRWEVAGYQGEVLGALGGALWAYQHVRTPGEAATHLDRVKQRLTNWYELPRAFVSYARRDARRVKSLVGQLERAHPGGQFIWDDRDFIPGLDLSGLIDWALGYVRDPSRAEVGRMVESALRFAGLYLVMWSRHSAARPWTRWELELATDHLATQRRRGMVGPRLVFVRLDAHPIPPEHRDRLWVDLSQGPRRGAALTALSRALTHSEWLTPSAGIRRRHDTDAQA